ncbi:hypothetical protein KPATCC21470_5347 [Kitasatospora purpeofusca]
MSRRRPPALGRGHLTGAASTRRPLSGRATSPMCPIVASPATRVHLPRPNSARRT